MSVVGIFDLTVTATDTKILSVPSDVQVRRITIANRGANDVIIRLFAVPKNTDNPPPVASIILFDVNIFPGHTEILGPDDIEIGAGDQIWARGTSAGIAVSFVMMT